MCSSLKAAVFIKATVQPRKFQKSLTVFKMPWLSQTWKGGDWQTSLILPLTVFHLFWGGGYLMEGAPKAVQKYLSWYLSSEMFALQACECQSFPGGAGSGAGDVCRGCSAQEELQDSVSMCLGPAAAGAEVVQCEVLCLCQGETVSR